MGKFKYIVLLFFLMLAYIAKAQQEPMYTQYMNQLLNINPAYAGAKGVTSATMLRRDQWLGGIVQEDAPKTTVLFGHSPLNDQVGVGVSLVADKAYVLSNYSLFFDYSYSLNYPGERSFAFGLSVGASLYQAGLAAIAGETVTLADGSVIDPTFVDIDHKLLWNFGVGCYYSTPKFYAGLSIPKLLPNNILSSDLEIDGVSREELHLFLMGGYVFQLNGILKLKPCILFKATSNSSPSLDLTAQLVLIDKVWAGVTYRVGNSVAAMVQFQVNNQLNIGCAYDLTTTSLRKYNVGTTEVMLTYDFSFGRGRVRSPRYF